MSAMQRKVDVPQQKPIVLIVDDDPEVRDAIASLLESVGNDVVAFGSAAAMIAAPPTEAPTCILMDIRMPGLGGLEAQRDLRMAGVDVPIIFLTGYGDVPMSVKAMKAGAVDFLTKPFREQDLLEAVSAAIDVDRKRRQSSDALRRLQLRYDTLTSREKEVMGFVSRGLLNKQIANEMGLSEITVKVHRGRMMRKLRLSSVADLVRMAEQLESAATP